LGTASTGLDVPAHMHTYAPV